MKEITIFQENNPPISFTDEDGNDLNKYTQELSSLLEVNNVIILETSSGSVIIRPHTISSIEVRNVNDEVKVETTSILIPQEIIEENKEQVTDVITDDFITDGD